MLRVPLTARKVRGGTEVDWVGYRVDVRECHLGVTTQRREALIEWCRKTAEGDLVLVRDLRAFLGKLVFAAGPLPHVKPFLGPAFAWVAAVQGGAALVPPLAVRIPLKWLCIMLERCSHRARAPLPGSPPGELFRVDAKAEGDDLAVIGGWAVGGGQDRGRAAWFSHRIRAAEYPWVFEKGRPFKVIAALELLAVLYGILLLVPDGDFGGATGLIPITAGTDNQGNQHLVRKMLTTKYPLCLVAMELAAQLTLKHLDLRLDWRPRESNVEADALTNEDFTGFDPARRVDAAGVHLKFACMPELEAATREWRRNRHKEGMAP